MTARAPLHLSPLRLGGGGYITGLTSDPHVPNALYARSDVGGVFRSVDGAHSWIPSNGGMTAAHHHMVQALAVSSLVPGLVLRCSGDARGGRRYGTIHRSDDHGHTWRSLTTRLDFFGNGPTRMMGETIACSPTDPNVVVAGAYSAGVWRSSDGGSSWTPVGLTGRRITAVAFHPRQADRLYVASCSDRVFGAVERGGRWKKETTSETCLRYSDEPRGHDGALYLSQDDGETWSVLLSGPDVTGLHFAPDGRLFATTLDGVLRSSDDGATWSPVDGLPGGVPYHAFAVSGSGVLYAAPDVRPGDDAPAIPVYRSHDSGTTWSLACDPVRPRMRDYPPYMSARHAGWAISTLLACPHAPERLYLANWFGVARSDDAGRSWNAHGFTGIETTCGETVTVDPHEPETVLLALADHRPTVSRDGGSSFSLVGIPHEIHATGALPGDARDTTVALASRLRRGLMLFGLTGRSAATRPSVLLRSVDGGRTVATTYTFPDELFIQALAEDPRTPGRFYAFLEGERAHGAGLYRSHDHGRTWAFVALAFPQRIRSFPHRRNRIDADLMPVVGYQIKNACGTQRHLCIDPHDDDTLFIAEWTEGIYRVREERDLEPIHESLPFELDERTVVTAIRSDPSAPGVLWAAFLERGVWTWRQESRSWNEAYPGRKEPYHATCLEVAGDGTVVVASEPIDERGSRGEFVVSRDHGRTWLRAHDERFGALRWKGVAVASTGAIYGLTCGNGGFRIHAADGT